MHRLAWAFRLGFCHTHLRRWNAGATRRKDLRQARLCKPSAHKIMKFCPKCQKTKELSGFAKNKARYDGYQSYCKACFKDVCRNYSQSHPEAVRARKQRHIDKDPDRVNQLRRIARRKRIEQGREKVYPPNKFIHALSESKRRATKKQNGIYSVIPKDARRLQRSNCFYCNQPANTIDHIVPIVRGGQHSIGNLVAACKSCNSSKSGNLLIVWKMKNRKEENGKGISRA